MADTPGNFLKTLTGSLFLSLSLGMLLSLGACSGDDQDANASSKPLTYEQFIQGYAPAVATILCRRNLECYSQSQRGPLLLLFSNYPDVASCEQAVLQGRLSIFGTADQAEQDAVAQERRAFDPEKAKECLALVNEITKLSCNPLVERVASLGENDPNDPCNAVIVGNVDVGGACQSSDDCKQESRKSRVCKGVSCPGATGGTCQDDDQLPCGKACSTKEYCDEENGSCRPRIPLGGACQITDACQQPAVCSLALRSCIRPKSVVSGALCGSDQECKAGFRCLIFGDDSTGKCRPLTYRKQGESCSQDFETEPGPCDKGLKCLLDADLKGTCEALSDSGGPCQQSYQCAPGLSCIGASSGANGSCGAPLPNGAACQNNVFDPFQCQSLNCDFTTSTCGIAATECSPS